MKENTKAYTYHRKQGGVMDTHIPEREVVVTSSPRHGTLRTAGMIVAAVLLTLLITVLGYEACDDDEVVRADIATQVGNRQPFKMGVTAEEDLRVRIEQQASVHTIRLPNPPYPVGCVVKQIGPNTWDCVPVKVCEEGEALVTRNGREDCEKIVTIETLEKRLTELEEEMVSEEELDEELRVVVPAAVALAIADALAVYTDEVLIKKLQSLESRLRALIRKDDCSVRYVPTAVPSCSHRTFSPTPGGTAYPYDPRPMGIPAKMPLP